MNKGSRVNRIECREVVGATVLKCDDENATALIAYDEGGQGWWPLNCLELQQPDYAGATDA